jgi:hypothetical protein
MVNIAISPADPNVLYLATADKPVRDAKRIRLLRTRDGGVSWDVLEELASNCLSNTAALQPHPTDAGRIFRQQTCNPGVSVNGALAESRDYGSTWTKLLDRSGYRPTRVVGGRGVMPERLYSQLWNWTRGNNVLVRSDDDGATWSETTEPWAGLTLPPEAEYVNLGGLDTDPTIADRLYAALNVNRSVQPPVVTTSFLLSRIMVSNDAGQSWADLGFGVRPWSLTSNSGSTA